MTRPMLYLLGGYAPAYGHCFGQIAHPLMTASANPTTAARAFRAWRAARR